MRNGIYAIYMGKEYEAGYKDPETLILRSSNSSDLDNGFSLHKGIIYTKSVHRRDLKQVYKISTIATYKGYKFEVLKEDGDKILLSVMSGDYRIYENLGMDMVDRGIYQKWVNKNEVTSLYEEKNTMI